MPQILSTWFVYTAPIQSQMVICPNTVETKLTHLTHYIGGKSNQLSETITITVTETLLRYTMWRMDVRRTKQNLGGR